MIQLSIIKNQLWLTITLRYIMKSGGQFTPKRGGQFGAKQRGQLKMK